MLVAFERLRPGPNVRTAFGDLGKLAESIRENDLRTALTVSPTADGFYLVQGGERRWRAIAILRAKAAEEGESLPFDQVDVSIRTPPKTREEEIYRSLAENFERRSLSAYELSLAISDLRAEGISWKEIEARTCLSSTSLQATAKIRTLSPKIRERLAAGLDVPRGLLISWAALGRQTQEGEFLKWLESEKTRKRGTPRKGRKIGRVSTEEALALLDDLENAKRGSWQRAVECLEWLLRLRTLRPVPRSEPGPIRAKTSMAESSKPSLGSGATVKRSRSPRR